MKELKISEFADVVTGGTPSTSVKEYWENGNIPWLNSGELNKGYIYNAENFITEAGLKNSSTKMMPADTVLIALTGATCGLSAISKIEACANQSVTGIIPSKNHVPEYLFHYLRTQRQRILDKAWGNAQPHISQAFVKDFKVPLPPLPDQLHIANLLSKAENLIAQRKESISLLDEFLKSTFLEMFGSNFYSEKRWKIEPFGDYINTLTDYHANGSYESLREIVNLKKEHDYALMVRTTDLENNNFENDCNYIDERAYNFLEKSKVFGGEIIINKIGSAGKVYLMPFLKRPVSLGMNAFLLRFDNRLNNLFTYFLLTSSFGENEIQKNVKGAVTKTITKDAIRKIKIPIPPIELQTQFAQIVEKTEALKTHYQQSLQELENLYDSLSQKAFKGELNLKDEGLLSSAEQGLSMAAEPNAEYKTNG